MIRNASMVVTMDPALGTLENADVLIEGDRIAAVGAGIQAGRAKVVDGHGKIVMPGFVDVHTHLWQSLIRGCGTDKELNGWLGGCVFPLFGSPINGQDAYAGVRLSTLDAISSGVTTVTDWSHAFNPGFARGNVQALNDSRMRYVFAYYRGPDDNEIRTVKRTLIDPNPLGHLQIGGRSAMVAVEELRGAERLSRELGVALNVHLHESKADPATGQMESLRVAGALRPGLLANHAIHMTDAELDELAAHDVRVAHNPLSNMRLASGIAKLPDMKARTIKVGLGLDGGTNDTSDMFNNLRAAAACNVRSPPTPPATPRPPTHCASRPSAAPKFWGWIRKSAHSHRARRPTCR